MARMCSVTYADVAHALEQSPTAQGYLVVETARGERRFVLGPKTHLEAEIPMLDWRTSPMAAVFFRHGPGQTYELETGDRTTEGRVIERWLTVGRGRLEALIGEDREIRADGETPRARPQPVRTPARDRDAVIVLDREQQDAVHRRGHAVTEEDPFPTFCVRVDDLGVVVEDVAEGLRVSARALGVAGAARVNHDDTVGSARERRDEIRFALVVDARDPRQDIDRPFPRRVRKAGEHEDARAVARGVKPSVRVRTPIGPGWIQAHRRG